jgi:hypothetical protein
MSRVLSAIVFVLLIVVFVQLITLSYQAEQIEIIETNLQETSDCVAVHDIYIQVLGNEVFPSKPSRQRGITPEVFERLELLDQLDGGEEL